MVKKFFILGLITTSVLMADRPALLSIGGGCANITGVRKMGLYQAEYKWKPVVAELRPQVGMFVTNAGSSFFYGGICYDLLLWNTLVLSPSFCPGVYFQGKGKNLGYPIEFKSAMDMAFRFSNEYRIGVSFYHLSNAHLSRRNPGVNVLAFYVSFPL